LKIKEKKSRIHILEGHFHRDSFALAGKENDIMYGLLGMVHILYKAKNSIIPPTRPAVVCTA